MRLLLSVTLLLAAFSLQAAVQEKKIEYNLDGNAMTGYLYWDDAIEGKRPGVLLIHEWWGLNDYARERARMLAELGYVAFAADMYGSGKVTTKASHAKGMMQAVTGDMNVWRGRGLAGLEQLQQSGMVDGDNVAAVGYCFGGASILQLAYADAPIKGAVAFHAALPPAPADASVNAKVLVLNGEDDAFVSQAAVAKFRDSMAAVGADLQLVNYAGVRHAYTNPDAGSHGIDNLKYDAFADEDSWKRMQAFLNSVFD